MSDNKLALGNTQDNTFEGNSSQSNQICALEEPILPIASSSKPDPNLKRVK